MVSWAPQADAVHCAEVAFCCRSDLYFCAPEGAPFFKGTTETWGFASRLAQSVSWFDSSCQQSRDGVQAVCGQKTFYEFLAAVNGTFPSIQVPWDSRDVFCLDKLELHLFLKDKYLVGHLTSCFNKRWAGLDESFRMAFGGLVVFCHLLGLTILLVCPKEKAGVVLDLEVQLSQVQNKYVAWTGSYNVIYFKTSQCSFCMSSVLTHRVLRITFSLGHAGTLVLVCCFSRGSQLLEECKPISLYHIWSHVR